MLLSSSIVSSSCAINSFFLFFQYFVLHHSIFLLLTRHFPQCIFHRHLLYYHHLLLLLLHLSDIHLFFLQFIRRLRYFHFRCYYRRLFPQMYLCYSKNSLSDNLRQNIRSLHQLLFHLIPIQNLGICYALLVVLHILPRIQHVL